MHLTAEQASAGEIDDAIARVRRYHEATKHRTDAYAPSPGFLDWDSQPDPFRRFAGAAVVNLPLENDGVTSYDALYDASPVPTAAPDLCSLGRFFELALGLSAWKSIGPDRWALRNNPSSGNLHPTEGYLIIWRQLTDELLPGLYHYAPYAHALERRALLPASAAAAIASAMDGAWGAFGLTSIIWREAWKYGARAFRYCQHDVGHALAAARFAARVNGWQLRVDMTPSDGTIARCLGLDRATDFAGAEHEHPDLIALLSDHEINADEADWDAVTDSYSHWQGQANKLSAERVEWPQITQVLPAITKPAGGRGLMPLTTSPLTTEFDSNQALRAGTIIRQRRSVQRMDRARGISRVAFDRMLTRTMPSNDHAPFDAMPFAPTINLLLFVHNVEDLEPGLYLLARTAARFDALRASCGNADLTWQPLTDSQLPLWRLAAPADLRKLAGQISCLQGIAAHGAFSLGMLADFTATLRREGAWAYRRLYWEAGMTGQVLYLEAEACGLRGTGIGCFFDDEVHRLLGIEPGANGDWQTLYHFTVGGAVEDRRLTTEPAYAHLEADRIS